MCGISGFISKKRITAGQLTAMNDTMRHRGPDDAGVEIFPASEGYSVGLAQRRLSILDLSPLGHQPMHAADGRVSLVYNGEIYNFRELREELSDYPFRSQCDTEVILAAYERWGMACLERFNGMFAIALFDRESQELYLVRDRIGKKPLYYWLDGENLVFGSELKAIMACPGFSGRINRDVLPVYLYQQYIPEPDTVFKDVRKVRPGEVVRFAVRPSGHSPAAMDKPAAADGLVAADGPAAADELSAMSGHLSSFRYWSVAERYREGISDPVTDYGQAKAELKALLQKSVRRRMIADVPLGTFLSGGYDSSLVTALAQEASEAPVKTFSIGFAEKEYDESVYAGQVARCLGTEHTERIITEGEMLSLVDSIPRYFDEPMADSSQIPTMLVSELARSQVTVALSGDGGDEFFCGYQMYRKLAQAQRLDGLGGLVYGISRLPGFQQAGFLSHLPFSVRTIAQNRDKRYKTQLCSDRYLACIKELTGTDQVRFDREGGYGVSDWQIRRMLLDMDTYLPGDILCKVDRASMKYSLEARCPLLDRDVMEYSFRLPHRFKDHKGCQKYILKEIAYDYIPRELLERPKSGFSVPLGKWLQGPLRERLTDYASPDFVRRQGLFEPETVQKLVQGWLASGDGGAYSGSNYSRILWAFFILGQWYETYLA
ncbi:MAG: asparagine synthase (glutamine-hydrolyzing) [Eubacteriales bacterium]|nr:asparagine synthase (glutamine-hydrolyzing) [Eubacteriales bacterium]